MKREPKVTVFLSSFNHAKYLREAIDSALSQSFTDFELIIWDDASSDESWAIINSYADPRIRKFRNDVRRRGVYGLNKAVSELAVGEYIAIHHSDDVWHADKLERQVSFLAAHPDVGAVFSSAFAIDDEGRLLDEDHLYQNIFDQRNRTRHEWLHFFFYGENVLCHPSVLVRKSCYHDCGLYRFGFGQIGDLDMWIRLCLRTEIHVLPEKLVSFRLRSNEANTSADRPDVRIRNLNEFRRLLENYRKIGSFAEFVKVFPSASVYDRGEDSSIDFALAMMILAGPPIGANEMFALDVLFEIISDPGKAAAIKRNYGFDYVDYVELTGKHDIYSREKTRSLEKVLADYLRDIESLKGALTASELERQTLREEIQKFETWGKRQVKEVAELQTVLRACEKDIEALKSSLTSAEAEKATLKDEVSSLKSELSIVTLEVECVVNSRSWRMTAPLRRGHAILSSLRRRK